jgi:hypothetical protein
METGITGGKNQSTYLKIKASRDRNKFLETQE